MTKAMSELLQGKLDADYKLGFGIGRETYAASPWHKITVPESLPTESGQYLFEHNNGTIYLRNYEPIQPLWWIGTYTRWASLNP